MDKNREARRGSMAAANGLSRRRQRSSSLRDSPGSNFSDFFRSDFSEEDGTAELQETARLRDRGNKKDRDRDRLSRNKRRRGDRLIHGSNREDGEESTEESVDDEEEDEDEESGAIRMLPPNPTSSSSLSNHPHRKNFPPAKVVRAAPSWKVADEMIGVSVPRKARSANAKRSHELWSGGGGGGGEQIHRQASTSPARPNATTSSPVPISPPSSSHISVRKKMKPIGPKHRPPKISKSSSSIQEDIEIEVAEVLYGLMRQSQCPPKQETLEKESQKLDSKDINGSSNEARSRVSSPVSTSPPAAAAHQPLMLPQNSSISTTPLSAVAPKRKRPRPVKFEEEAPANFSGRNGSISSAATETEQPAKVEISSPKLEKNAGSAVENAGASSPAAAAVSSLEQPQSESFKAGNKSISDPKPLTEEPETQDGVQTREEVPALEKDSLCTKLEDHLDDATATKSVLTGLEVDGKREEKFKIDLMAPLKSSPERDGDIDCASDLKPVAVDVETVQKMETVVKVDEKVAKFGNQNSGEVGLEEKKMDAMEESESQKPVANKERILDLQLDLEKADEDSGTGSKHEQQLQHQQVQKQQQQQQPKASRNDSKTEKTGQSTSLPLPMPLAGWPGCGLPSLGYMPPPLQAVVSMEGNTGSSTAAQQSGFLLTQPRPKKCATHYYIARNIYYHQQFTRMPFWPAAAGSASLYGAKPYNLNMVPPTETTILGNPLQGSFPSRNLSSVQDKGQVAATFSGHNAKDKNSAVTPASIIDAAQKKQLVLQHAPQPAAAGNLLHGPAIIFPMSQQQAAATAATRSGPVKSATTTCNTTSSAANSALGAPASSPATEAMTTTVSFNYPNFNANEAQYLTIMPNNGYPFPIPAHVGMPPPYRGGSHAQSMPFYSGPFYSPQMIHHPSHLQPQQQQQQPPVTQLQPIQQGHQNTSTSSGSSSSQKHQQTQQQRLQGGSSNGGGGSSHNISASKNRPPMQQKQQQNQHVSAPHQSRQLEAEMGGEDTLSTADGRVSHPHKSIYSHNFTVPIHQQNFALMTPAALGGVGGGNHGDKQQQQHQSQQQNLKGGVELLSSQAFAMSFASLSGAANASGLDYSSMANHAIFQSLPEAARRGYQIAAAQVAQQQKNHQISEEGKTGGDSINAEDERKLMAGRAPVNMGQSVAFSRPGSTDQSVSTGLGNAVNDGSARINIISAPVNGNRATRSVTSSTTTSASAPASIPNSLHQQQQQQQRINILQQQYLAAAWSKASTSSNASVYSDHLPSSSSMAAKFPNTLSDFPQALAQSSSPAQSPQWKNTRTTAAPVPSPSPTSTTTSPLKNLPQQQARTQQGQTQITFGGNPKLATAPPGQQLLINNQSPSPPLVVGSPPTSISKSTGGSPRTTSTGGKSGPAPTLSSQQAKSSPSSSSRKSSPVGGRNVPSILNNSHITTTPTSSAKSQLLQLQQQQQLQKQTLQQPQLFFTNAAFMQAPSPHSSATFTTTSSTAGYYHQRQQQQQQGSSSTATNGMLSLCPPLHTLAGATASDPTKAAAANHMKGGLPPHGLLQAAQFAAQAAGNSHHFMSAGVPYMHPMPTVSLKPAEQKQHAGNDNLHACWQPEKR